MSLLSDALAIHASRLKESAGEVVTYRRGSLSAVITAVIGQTVFEELGGDGEIRVQTKSTDFIFATDDLKLDGDAIEPKRGDQVIKTSGDVFDLLPGSFGNSWSWNDGRQTHIRVHTVRRVKG